jgi:tetratricopeptide (TPR) repeat protein
MADKLPDKVLRPQPLDVSEEAVRREITRLERIEARSSTVIVIDDMQTMRLLLAQALRGAGFDSIQRAPDGETGLRLMREFDTDLAIVDWNMPRMDGLELLEQVRTDEYLESMVFIMVTAETLDAKVIQAAEEQQDAYLTKPISPDRLSRRLMLILDKRMVYARAKLLEIQGEVDLAVDMFINAMHNRPNVLWPLFGMGALLFRHGRWEEAEQAYGRILEMDDNALAALVELGRVKEARGSAEEGRELYMEAVRKNPQLFKAYDALAESLFLGGDLESALDVVQGALRAQGTENAGRQELLGRLQLTLGNYMDAENAFDKALALKPLRHQVPNNLFLGRSRFAQDKYDEAISVLKRASSPRARGGMDRDRLEAMLLTGQSYLRLDRDELAQKEFDSIHLPESWPRMELPFEPKELHREVGGVYLEEGREENARNEFLASVLKDGRDEENLRAIRDICKDRGRDDWAQQDFSNVESSQLTMMVERHTRRGLIMVSQGRLSDAEKEYQKALELDRSAGRLYFNIGKLHFRMQKADQGIKDMAMAARMGAMVQDWDLMVEVARFLAQIGMQAQGRALLKQVQLKKPGLRSVATALAEIEKQG